MTDIEIQERLSIFMNEYTVLKSSREELLKKAGYAEPHILYRPAPSVIPISPDMDGETADNTMTSADA
jgi:hypothetical protein